jgi:soluble lytic murein transglycosylase-like protein
MSANPLHLTQPPEKPPREIKQGRSQLFNYLLLVELVLIFSMVASYLILMVINLQNPPTDTPNRDINHRNLLRNYRILRDFNTLAIRTAPIQDTEFEIGNPFVADLFTLKTAASELEENREKSTGRITDTLLQLETRHQSHPHRYTFILHKKNELYLKVLYLEKKYGEFITLANRFPDLIDTLELRLFQTVSFIRTGDAANSYERFKALFARHKLAPFEQNLPRQTLRAYLQRLDYDFWLAKFTYLAETNQYSEFQREKSLARSPQLVNLMEAEFSYRRKNYEQCRNILSKIKDETLLPYKERLIFKLDLRENNYDAARIAEQLTALKREPEVYYDVLLDAGGILMIAGEGGLAADLFSRYISHSQMLLYVRWVRSMALNRPTLSPLGSDYWKALWISAWLHYKKNNREKALFYFREGVDSPILSYRMANRYWLLRLDNGAVISFDLGRYPFSYYYTLNNPLQDSMQSLYTESLQPFIHLLNQEQSPRFPGILSDLKALIQTNLIDEALEFIHWIREKIELPVSDKHLLVLIESQLYLRQGNDAMAFIRFRDHFECYQCLRLPRFLSRIALPVKYLDLVDRYSKINNLDPFLVLSIIREESFFRPDAVSPANAYGLMQLLLRTARQVAYSHDLKVFRSDLFQPAINIRLGTEYFKILLNKYNGKLHLALAAYNAGDQRVDEWLNRFGTNEPEEFIEMIPFTATRNYVKNILRNYYYYRFYYGEASESGG